MREIKIVSDNEMTEKALRRFVDLALEGKEKLGEKNVILVDVNTVFLPTQNRVDNMGLKMAQDLVKNESDVIILMGLENQESLKRRDRLFSVLLAYPNVEYIDILNIKEELLPAYQKIVSGKKVMDKTTIAIHELKEWEEVISRLRHVINYAKKTPEAYKEWVKKAKEIGLTGTDKEMFEFVENWKPGSAGKFEGKYFEGIFVDAFETLFDENWRLIPAVKSAVEKLAEEKNKQIFVISDSEQSELKKKLEEVGITWSLISKYDMRGASLEIVIDNLSQKEFESTYQIKPREFINVKTIQDFLK